MVFCRDISILRPVRAVHHRGSARFQSSIFGKANTFAQVSAVFFVLLFQVEPLRPVWIARTFSSGPPSRLQSFRCALRIPVQHRLRASRRKQGQPGDWQAGA